MAFSAPFYRWRPHPWHGLSPGPDAPATVEAFIEITPFDLIKYEVDKVTGYMRVDRPQRGSSQPPTLYGFIPQTVCGMKFSEFSPQAIRGDGDPLDICVLSERPIERGEVIVRARVVGGLQCVDREEADDKILAVVANDPFWGQAHDLEDLPLALVERLQHYFSTYKMAPGGDSVLTIERVYGVDHARQVVQAAMDDYDDEYGK